MSLKAEQRLDNFFFTEEVPKIYSTGVYLLPMKIMKGTEERYVWVAYEFEDDTFSSPGGELCSPVLLGCDLQELIQT